VGYFSSLLGDTYKVSVDDQKVADEKLLQLGYEFAGRYSSRLSEELIKETRQALADFFGEERATQLRALKSSSKDSDRKEFDAAVKKKAETRYIEAMTELADQLKVKTDDLLINADAG